jgi:hypothetical protein
MASSSRRADRGAISANAISANAISANAIVTYQWA